MRQPLRILSLEDDPDDAGLMQERLEADGIACDLVRVDTQPAFEASIGESFDLILADYTLPSFDGLCALRLAISACPDVPFIFVSGTLGEEVAIEALKIGATDYVLKSRLLRLVPSVLRALREADERTARRRAQEALARSENHLAECRGLPIREAGSGRWLEESSCMYRTNGAGSMVSTSKTACQLGNKGCSVFIPKIAKSGKAALRGRLFKSRTTKSNTALFSPAVLSGLSTSLATRS